MGRFMLHEAQGLLGHPEYVRNGHLFGFGEEDGEGIAATETILMGEFLDQFQCF
jgi:hypothetical protein